MTEDEAKRRPCIGPENCGTRSSIRWCVASECLAWRDLYETANVREIIEDFSQFRISMVARPVKSGGYCGLAGKPE